jgi:hypothetical protein
VRVRVLGGGWYGCHLASALIEAGHEVELHESAARLFSGASGGNPARLHKGFHYPRSRLTRAACQEHADAFMARYGHLTRTVPINLYAVAAAISLVDFGTYRDTMASSGLEFLTVTDPAAYGLADVEGALLTGERHIVIDEARAHFRACLEGAVHYGCRAGCLSDPAWDLTIDCTFCALDAEAIDRYEPCLTVLLEGPTDKAVTIMDGPLPSIYPWNEDQGLISLTSASLTPLSKTCRTWAEANAVLNGASAADLGERAYAMLRQMARFWPAAADLFRIADTRLTVRAMPRSGADARLVDVVRVGERTLRVRAGKIDAVFRAEALIKEAIAA